jgi:hypothetical protein
MPQLAALVPLISAVTGIAGAGSSLYNTYENQQYQDKLRSYAENPNKLESYAAGFTQPPTAGLVQGVENQAQGYAAERGLATSPAAEQQIVSQAIAPYIQQNQQLGLGTALQALGLGGGASPNPAGGFTGLAASLAQLSKLFQPSAPGANQTAQQVYNADTDAIESSLPQIPYEPYSTVDLNNFAFAPAGG